MPCAGTISLKKLGALSNMISYKMESAPKIVEASMFLLNMEIKSPKYNL